MFCIVRVFVVYVWWIRRESLFHQQLGELNALKKYRKELEDQNKRINGDYQKATTKVLSLEDQSKKISFELENTKSKGDSAGKESSQQRDRADAAAAQLAAAIAKARALQEDLNLERYITLHPFRPVSALAVLC
jgi:peptidoglycan hydrolase CwlO-like protein